MTTTLKNRFGGKLKTLRKEKQITLKELADLTELSTGYISKIERGLSFPSINNLQKICYVLKITVNDLIVEETGQRDFNGIADSGIRVYGKENRNLIYDYNDTFRLESILPGGISPKVDILTLSGDGQEFSSSKHRYDEIGILLSGSLEIRAGEDCFVPEREEAIFIPKGTEHTIRKLSAEACTSIWIKV